MALDTTSSESAQDAVRNSGFYCEKDPLVGGEFLRMQREGFTLLSKDGLEFYEVNILNNKRVRSVLDSLLLDYGLSRCRYFQSDPGHRFQFSSGGERAGQNVIVVLLWDKASTVTFYRGSHHLDIPGPGASNGLWEIPAAKLDLGKAEWFAFEHGGLTIQDARTVFEIVHGTPIAAIFGTHDVLRRWSKWGLPDTPDVVQKVAEMNRTRVPLNALFLATEEERPPSVAAPEDDPCPYWFYVLL
ncbi:hypothetical protein F5883DRAFT_649323 [Diaporthe sp. PMI_573]|nr:hypothetical protein F5883DRAFT_649323 [Diaporthaceae sp. PMI_573]